MHTSLNIALTENPVNLLSFTNYFPSFQELNANKPYVALAGCALDHILCSTEISNLAKLTYILCDSLALKNHHQNGKHRAVDLSAENWASWLNCSKTEVYTIQKELEEKGYFVIKRRANQEGRNQKNKITPTLPDHVFQALCKSTTRWNADITWDADILPGSVSKAEWKRLCLDNTKLFIPLNFPLLKLVAASSNNSTFSKLLFIDLQNSRHKYHMKKKNDINQQNNFTGNATDQSFIISYKELAIKFNCSTGTISKTIVELEKLGFIEKQRFFVSNDNDDDNRHDKSLWSITISLPPSIAIELAKQPNRAASTIGNITREEHRAHYVQYYTDNISTDTKNLPLKPASSGVISCTDPRISKIGQYNNKEYILNIKDPDDLDSEVKFLKKSGKINSKVEDLSELSVSCNNFIQEEASALNQQLESFVEFEQDAEFLQEQLTYNDVSSDVVKTEAYSDIKQSEADDTTNQSIQLLEVEQTKISDIATMLSPTNLDLAENASNQDVVILTDKSTDQVATGQLTTKESPAVDTNAVANSHRINDTGMESTTTKSISQKTVKFQPNAKLKDWYPLDKKDVDLINSKSDREFSINFVNELLLKLDSKYPDRVFDSKNHVISYMSKALRYEKHQGPLVNHETFRFVRDDQEFIAARQREKYLTEVEYGIDNSYASQLRRKIAALFDSKTAYQLLTRGIFDYHCDNSVTDDQQDKYSPEIENELDDQSSLEPEFTEIDNIASVQDTGMLAIQYLKTNILPDQQNSLLETSLTAKIPSCLKLTDHQRETLENAIIAVYGYIDITYQQISSMYNKQGNSQLRQPGEIYLEELDHSSAWYKIRKELKNNLGEYIDKAWFSKLTYQENLGNKTLTLIAPSNFIRDYIKNHYKRLVEQLCKEFGCNMVEFVSKDQMVAA